MRILTLLLLLCLALPLSAQEAQPFAIKHTIASEVFGTDRQITVYLPPAYYRYPDDTYTITYVLDGQYAPFIDAVVKTIEYNANAYKITPTIVVGVHSENRGREFTTAMDADDPQDGRAPALQQHFREEIFPLIDSLYPDRKDYRSIIGHSSGGLFVLYTLFSDQVDLFDGYVGISPALRPGNNRILETARERLSEGITTHKFLYCASGTVGEREELFGGAITRLDALLEEYPKHGLSWHPARLAGLDHWSVVMPAVVDGLLAQTRTYRVDEKLWQDWSALPVDAMLEKVTTLYERASSVYGFQEIPSVRYLRSVAQEISRRGRTQQALAVFDWGLTQYPENFFLTKSKAILYADTGDKKAARAGFEACVKLLPALKEQESEERYMANKEDLAERLAELE